MLNLHIENRRRTPKDKDGNVYREIGYKAVILETSLQETLKHSSVIKTPSVGDFYYHSIDKLTFSLSTDYLNDDSYGTKYTGGAVVIRKYGSYFCINLNKEYIPIDRSIKEYVEDMFRFLAFNINLFQLPIKKTVMDYKNGLVTETEFPENKVTTAENFLKRILEETKLKCIELCFDMHLRIREFVNRNDFRNYKGTLYSIKDYKVYESKNIKKSLICIYDKTKQLEDVKHRKILSHIERFEIRLFDTSYTIMKKHSMELLDHTYEELVDILLPHIVKHMKKLGLDFTRLLERLSDNQKILQKILKTTMNILCN